MYLAFTLKDIGFQVRREKDGPDFWIDGKGGRIWIEAIAPGPGDSAKPDYVPEPPGKSATRPLGRSSYD
jgi:hypothetical protein